MLERGLEIIWVTIASLLGFGCVLAAVVGVAIWRHVRFLKTQAHLVWP